MAASFSKGKEEGASRVETEMGRTPKQSQSSQTRNATHDRRIKKDRNRQLAIALVLLVTDALISLVFTLLAPTDPRLNEVFASRRQLRTVYMQGVVAIVDALISVAVVVHVVQGILSASLDQFLEAAATKLLQAIFFSLLQTGYPTVLRLCIVTLLLLFRVAAASLIFRAAFLSGVLTARPSRNLPRLIVSLLEMGAPIPQPGTHARLMNAQLYALERPLTIELVERLIRWLVPLRERAASVGMGRRQVLLISSFLLAMTAYSAFYEYWSILGDQDEFFVEGQREQIVEDSFSYLASAAYAVGQSARNVREARPFLPSNITSSSHRVVVIVLSGLRYDAMQLGGGDASADASDGAALSRFRASLGADALLCQLQAEVPSLSVPNWIGLLTGLRPEMHGLLGNRGPAEQHYSSLFSITNALAIPSVLVGTPWMVDLVRSQLPPLASDGSTSASWLKFEALTAEADAYDEQREDALMRALNTTSRLVMAQLSQINTAGHLNGVSYVSGAPYAIAIRQKARLLDRVLAAIDQPGAPPTTLVVVSDHGHLDRGGCGGGTPVERQVPLLIYRKGSALGSQSQDAATPYEQCVAGAHSTVDVAPTVAALLGVPVPRHSQGDFVTALFDADDAQGHTTDAAYAAVAAKAVSMGSQLFRRLETWQWKDMYYQQHSFVSNFLLNPGVNNRAALDGLDTNDVTRNLLQVAQGGSASAYQQLTAELVSLFLSQRDSASSLTSTRTQCVAAFILILVFGLVMFAMQVQTFCDPLVVFTPRRSGWRTSHDVQAAFLTLVLTAIYYTLTVVIFMAWLGASQFQWSSSIVSLPENVRSFLVVALLPGGAVAYGLSRITALRYAVLPTGGEGQRVPLMSLLIFVFFEEIQAYHRIEMLYLCRFYAVVWTIVAIAILGILASRFSFIVPLIFYNKYIDEALWEYRFHIMTLQVMSIPLFLANMFALYRWPATRVDLQAMNAIHALKVQKAERRRLAVDGAPMEISTTHGSDTGCVRSEPPSCSSMLTEAAALDADEAGNARKGGVLRKRLAATAGGGDEGGRGNRREEEEATRDEMATRFEIVHQQLLEQRQDQVEMANETVRLEERSRELEEELEDVLEEVRGNQNQINAGIKELETLIIKRFETMQEAEDEKQRINEAKQAAFAGGDGAGTAGDDADNEADMAALDPAARRELRRQRLINEQRKRIAEEEAEKRDADAQIRALQAELAKLLEANGRLNRKVEACEHNVDETRDAIEDMAFQKTQCHVQKENALAVLTGEANYLNEHQVTVQRKASELTSKMTEIEAAINAGSYKLQRVNHTNELATADRRRELEALEAEAQGLQRKFEQVRNDVRTLYGDKASLHRQLQSAQAEAADVEATVSQYRKSVANLLA